MALVGWKRLLDGAPWFEGEGNYPIAAYSEYMPPPRLGRKAYSSHVDCLFAEEDPWGWHITEYEEARELQPGLDHLARTLVSVFVHLGRGEAAHGIAESKLTENPYWPRALAERAGALRHERYVVLLPLALSRTQDDKGRVRWTLFGGSEHGPGRAFWQGSFTAPGRARPADDALRFLNRLLHRVFGEQADLFEDPNSAGFRILPDPQPLMPHWQEGPLPDWTEPFLWKPGQSLRGVRYLLTFQPFARLPQPVQRAYLAGELNLLPFPGSLLFWGIQSYQRLADDLPLATQIPLLHSVPRHEGPFGIRVPQSGWIHEARSGKPGPGKLGPFRNTYHRTHRWARVHRDEDELAIESCPQPLLHVLFSTDPEDMGLYGKPMARNVQLWTHDFQALLDGPRADADAIKHAEHVAAQGGVFGYRFQFPAMRVGLHEVYWHRPLAAFLCPETGQPALIPGAPLGFLTAYDADRPEVGRPVILWPRLRERQADLAAVQLFQHVHDPRPYLTGRNVRKLLETHRLLERPLPRSLARQLLNLPRNQTLEGWLDQLPQLASNSEQGRRLSEQLVHCLEPRTRAAKPRSRALTLARTARRPFEVAYWRTIARLAEGKYCNKDNADCVRDSVTQAILRQHHRHLEELGDYLLTYYRRKVAQARLTGKALVGDLPFRWQTDFDFGWMGGWLRNQEGKGQERNLMVVIPGRDRRRAIIMADHYDTAYMADYYEKDQGGAGARVAAAGADDNHSATATLMLGAPVFLALSRAGRLACDIWLIHLTGEEFPADCLGARHLTQLLVEKRLALHLGPDTLADLSRVRVEGVYVLDMIAHNNDRARDIFQIAPGACADSMRLAQWAHEANEAWNEGTRLWNRRPSRKHAGRGRRSADPNVVPAVARHPTLSGEIRPPYDPRSTLYNTDGQIFSDAGIPVVLFMENYDINRTGYHDSHDTIENIDLDYGAAVAAIAIESVARAASAGSGRRRPRS